MQVNIGLWPEKDLHWEPGREFEKGMIFSSRVAVQKCATLYSMRAKREHKSSRTTESTLVLICRNIDVCNWRLHARKLTRSGEWTITRYNGSHICNFDGNFQDHRNFRARYIREYIQSQLKEQRDIKIKTLQAGLLERFGVKPHYKKTWHARERQLQACLENGISPLRRSATLWQMWKSQILEQYGMLKACSS
ncbi:uncharacterized protein LOC126683319 [Mercurialis annua]|uniref:uncharacterized protein LOC126683319 n=1 Tax=Mercurialis annua TaxID=3986 RepID=UPI00215F337F|nr:uncharacterized protein LOC126683319 [Mercurialis annua]